MSSRTSFRQNLKAAAKRRAKRKCAAPPPPSPEATSTSNRHTQALDCVLESFNQWTQEWTGAMDADVAAALRECLTGRSASTDAGRSLVTRWSQDRLNAMNGEGTVRGPDIQSALDELAKLGQAHRSNQHPRSFIEFLRTLLS